MKKEVKEVARWTPIHVSPVIRFTRYLFLLVGVAYGINKKMYLDGYEQSVKPKREKLIHDRIEKEQLKSKEDYRALLLDFAEIFGVDLPDDWEPPM